MSKKRYISDSFWSDNWVEELDPLERYLYLYLLTNQLVSICGIYEIKEKRIAYETGIDKDMILKMFQRFEQAGKVFYTDGILCIVNFVKNQNIKNENDNLWKGIVREIEEIGSDKLKLLFSKKGLVRGLQGAYKDVPIPYLTLLNLTLPNYTEISDSDFSDIEIKKEKTPKEIENEETANILSDLRKIVGLDKFKDYKEWTEAGLCLRILKKIGQEEFTFRITTILSDDFKRKNSNKLEYLRKEIESFIHSPMIQPNSGPR